MYATLFKPRILVPSYQSSLNLTRIQVSKYPENLALMIFVGSGWEAGLVILHLCIVQFSEFYIFDTLWPRTHSFYSYPPLCKTYMHDLSFVNPAKFSCFNSLGGLKSRSISGTQTATEINIEAVVNNPRPLLKVQLSKTYPTVVCGH